MTPDPTVPTPETNAFKEWLETPFPAAPDTPQAEPLTSFTPRGDDGYEMVGSPLDNLKRYHAEVAALRARVAELEGENARLVDAWNVVYLKLLNADPHYPGKMFLDSMCDAIIANNTHLRAELAAIRAACEPFRMCRRPLDLGSRCGECHGCRLAALLAPKADAPGE